MKTYTPVIVASASRPTNAAYYPPGVAECRAPLLRTIPLPNVRDAYALASNSARCHNPEPASLCKAPMIRPEALPSHDGCPYCYQVGPYMQTSCRRNDRHSAYWHAPSPQSAMPVVASQSPYAYSQCLSPSGTYTPPTAQDSRRSWDSETRFQRAARRG